MRPRTEPRTQSVSHRTFWIRLSKLRDVYEAVTLA
jgi:hypothetical protein